mmetsp:Transcript_32231/g.63810  ORF Transcript_32231/g.63810 Transcript_32231/m.63810 type:complete len:580 (+) Transcript_32231:2-1741(+)
MAQDTNQACNSESTDGFFTQVAEISEVPFQDTSTDCAICLSPLDGDDDDEDGDGGSISNDHGSNPKAATITLSCGHRWHLSCVEEQLRRALPDRSRRLLFSGCRCAKCGAFCDHELLREITRRTDALRGRVDALVRERLAVDLPPEEWARADDVRRAELVEGGRRRYAFYRCGSCDGPYFGGTVACADDADAWDGGGEERLCPSCSPALQAACRDPVVHRGHHVWKCRYCCRPATHVCYGSVHFCDSCHDRNSAHVRAKRERKSRRGRSGIATGTSLEETLVAIPCPGGDACSFPKPEGRSTHSNGPSKESEQVYHCAICSSGGDGLPLEMPGSRNFVKNPSGEEGLAHWTQQSRSHTWAVEQSDIPPDADTSSNFVSTYEWCVMRQEVPLHRYVTDPSVARVEISASYMGRTDCPSVFGIEALLFDSGRNELRRAGSSLLEAPVDSWERATVVFEPEPGLHTIVVVVYGKDRRFWQGTFGSKVANCSVRVLGEEGVLRDMLLPPDAAVDEMEADAAVDEVEAGAARDEVAADAALNEVEADAAADGMEARRELWRKHMFDFMLPFLMVLFAWAVSHLQ